MELLYIFFAPVAALIWFIISAVDFFRTRNDKKSIQHIEARSMLIISFIVLVTLVGAEGYLLYTLSQAVKYM